MREICLDTETTGLDPKDGHKIIEIAGVELVNKVKTGKFFHCYINPRRDVPFEAFKVHGISTEFLKDKPFFDHIADKFLEFIKDDILVIHNASFDLKFLNHELKIINRPIIDSKRVSDSLLIARNKFPGSANSLDALCKRFAIDLTKRQKHGALVDSELLCDVYIELMGGAQTNFFSTENNLHQQQTKENIENNNHQDFLTNFNNKKITDFKLRNFELTAKQIEDHRDFILKNFKTNLWNY